VHKVKMKISRRSFTVVLSGAAFAGLMSFVPSAVVQNTGIIKAIIFHRFGGLRISETDLESFSENFIRSRQRNTATPLWAGDAFLSALFHASSVVGVDGIEKISFSPFVKRLDALERAVVTEFILATNVLNVGNRVTEWVEYQPVGNVCPNPFAQFGAE
jgi:hypothetical protein